MALSADPRSPLVDLPPTLSAKARAFAKRLLLPPLDVLTGAAVDRRFAEAAAGKPIRGLRLAGLSRKQVAKLGLLAHLQELEVTDSNLVDLEPLAKLRRLKQLLITGCRVTDVTPLAGLARLDYLDLSYNPRLRSIAPLKGLRRLKRLELADTAASDLAPLAGMRHLDCLGIEGAPVADLSPLAGSPRLEVLRADETRIRDLSPLRGLPRLFAVDLRATPVLDVSALFDVPNLLSVDFSATDVPETHGAALEAHLRRHQPSVTVAPDREALVVIPGVLDANLFGVVEKLFAAGRLKVESSEVLVNEWYAVRSKDHTRITAMAFKAEAQTLTLLLRLPDGEQALELVEPRDVRVGPDVFFIGSAKKIWLDGKPMKTDGRSAFRLVAKVFVMPGWEAVRAPRRKWHRALQAKLEGEKARGRTGAGH